MTSACDKIIRACTTPRSPRSTRSSRSPHASACSTASMPTPTQLPPDPSSDRAPRGRVPNMPWHLVVIQVPSCCYTFIISYNSTGTTGKRPRGCLRVTQIGTYHPTARRAAPLCQSYALPAHCPLTHLPVAARVARTTPHAQTPLVQSPSHPASIRWRCQRPDALTVLACCRGQCDAEEAML